MWRRYIDITMKILGNIDRFVSYLKTWHFGDWILSPSEYLPSDDGDRIQSPKRRGFKINHRTMEKFNTVIGTSDYVYD
jgi:hypothetical protein